MTDEIKIDGLGLAPGVLETIVTLATEQVPGVFGVNPPGLAGKVGKPGSRQIEVSVDEAGAVAVVIHVHAVYGTPLPQIAEGIKDSVADAIVSQVGAKVASVDVFIDGVTFEG